MVEHHEAFMQPAQSNKHIASITRGFLAEASCCSAVSSLSSLQDAVCLWSQCAANLLPVPPTDETSHHVDTQVQSKSSSIQHWQGSRVVIPQVPAVMQPQVCSSIFKSTSLLPFFAGSKSWRAQQPPIEHTVHPQQVGAHRVPQEWARH